MGFFDKIGHEYFSIKDFFEKKIEEKRREEQGAKAEAENIKLKNDITSVTHKINNNVIVNNSYSNTLVNSVGKTVKSVSNLNTILKNSVDSNLEQQYLDSLYPDNESKYMLRKRMLDIAIEKNNYKNKMILTQVTIIVLMILFIAGTHRIMMKK